MVKGESDMEKTSTLENFERQPMVYCKIVKTLVDITLCLEGGPMQADGPCEHFIELEKNEKGELLFLIDAIPTRQKIEQTIVKC